jgi:hypothetical protein
LLVQEGSGGIWERLYYNWSDPNPVDLIPDKVSYEQAAPIFCAVLHGL